MHLRVFAKLSMRENLLAFFDIEATQVGKVPARRAWIAHDLWRRLSLHSSVGLVDVKHFKLSSDGMSIAFVGTQRIVKQYSPTPQRVLIVFLGLGCNMHIPD